MRIDGMGPPAPLPPGASGPAAQPASAAGPSLPSLVAQSLLQQEQKGGGGGGHAGGHGAKKIALDAIDDIASRASLNIRRTARKGGLTYDEIEALKEELAAENGRVGEREPDDRQPDDRQPDEREEPAAD